MCVCVCVCFCANEIISLEVRSQIYVSRAKVHDCLHKFTVIKFTMPFNMAVDLYNNGGDPE